MMKEGCQVLFAVEHGEVAIKVSEVHACLNSFRSPLPAFARGGPAPSVFPLPRVFLGAKLSAATGAPQLPASRSHQRRHKCGIRRAPSLTYVGSADDRSHCLTVMVDLKKLH